MMDGTITYDGGRFNIRASAAVLIRYKEQFGAEYTDDYAEMGSNILNSVIVGKRLLWCMAKCADTSIPAPDAFYSDIEGKCDIVDAIIKASEMMKDSLGEFVSDEAEEGGGDNESYELSESLTSSAIRFGFSVADMNEISTGFMLKAMLKSVKNVESDKPREATDEDIENFKRFFGA